MNEMAADEATPGIIESLWRYRWSSLAIVGIMVVLSAAVGYFVAPGAQATAVIALATPSARNPLAPGIQGDASLARYTAQRAGYVTSDAVLSMVAEDLGREDLTSLRREVSVDASATSNTINITTEAKTPEEAVELADAVIAAYRSRTEAEVVRLTDTAVASIDESVQEIEQDLPPVPDSGVVTSAAADTLSSLQLEATDLRTTARLFGDGVEYVIAPRADAVTEPGIPIREVAVGFLLGVVIAATVAWSRADRERATSSDSARSLQRSAISLFKRE